MTENEKEASPQAAPKENEKIDPADLKFGAFKGVFTPSVLTILGVIMYLRFGWVLGNVGPLQTILIVTMATGITFLTALSISAIATNMKVGGGGVYYMISRSLGVEAGAAVGLPLFLAQALGISFYIAGFSESVVNIYPELSQTMVGLVTLILLTGLAFVSADMALKTQFVILALIVASLVSFFSGSAPSNIVFDEAKFHALRETNFWVVFAVFFPAVTGIEAGLAMSGDLKDPAKSLPRGTLGAVITGYLVYLAIPVFLWMQISDRRILVTDPLIMAKIARHENLIIAGLWGATLSSALGALLGAPRTLQALARDRVLPRILGKGHGPSDEPRIATLVAFGVALVGVLAGDLNLIAPVLSMFFLTSYGVLNISAAFEGLLASPSWRPTFKVKWPISLLGAICCFATMFMINAGATFMAASVSLGVFYYMQHKKMNAHWGDVSYGMMMFVAQKAIYSLATRRADERTWRPNILVLSGSPTTRWYLIELANAMSIGKGLLTVAAILPEDGIDSERRENMRTSIKGHLAKKGVPALVKIQAASDPIAGACSLVETYGFGPLRPNTFLLGETEKEENFINYAKLIKNVYDTRRNLVIVREGAEGTSSNIKRTIDVWWGRQRQNVGLMLALAHLLQSAPEWRRARLVLKSIVFKEDEKEEAVNRLQKFVENSRLKAEIAVIVKKEEEEVFETIRKSSRLVDLVFIGMRPPHTLKNLGEQADLGDSICEKEETLEEYAEYYSRLIERTNGYPPTAIVLATEDIEFTRIFE